MLSHIGRGWIFFKRVVIGPLDDPYLIRFILVRTPKHGGIYIHHMLRSDHDRSLHDHPWDFTSIVLKGGYMELVDNNTTGKLMFNAPGAIIHRPAEWKHRVILSEGRTCWTLVFVSKKLRQWGFWINDIQWCWWRKYNQNKGICEDEILHKEN
jgi:hypothetical protein